MSTPDEQLPPPNPRTETFVVRWKEKGKWHEEALTNAHQAVERARKHSRQHPTVYVMRACWVVFARMERGEQTLARTLTLYSGEEP